MWAPDLTKPPMDMPGTAVAILPSAIGVAGPDGKALLRIKLLPYGTFRGKDGSGPWVLSGKAHAYEVIAATRDFQRGARMMFDFDHQSIFAPARNHGISGSIEPQSLSAESDGIYANVNWTPVAEAAIKDKVYRFHAAHVMAVKRTGHITRIIGGGLTNTAAEYPVLSAAQLSASEPDKARRLTAEEASACDMLGLSPDAFVAARDEEAAHRHAVAQLTKEELQVCEMTGVSPQAVLAAREEEAAHQRAIARLTKEELQACEMTGVAPQAVLAARDEEAAHQRAVAQLSKDELRACEMTGMKPEDFIRARGF